jgi:probable rRNA maturation factor
MHKLKVYISDNQTAVKLPSGLRILVRRCCHAVLDAAGFEGAAELSITFVDDEEIMKLNAKHRQVNEPTDVLSFPMGENGVYSENPETGCKILGDIVISAPCAFRQAKEYNFHFQREFCYLTAHGVLHLLGYDHIEPLDKVHMREKEELALTQLGYPRSGSYVLDD